MIASKHLKVPTVLDVSLRDGGYLNDWCFSQEAIDLVVVTAIKADADVIEIGYCDDEPELPAAAACPTTMIERIRRLAGRRPLAAMIRPSVKNPAAVLSARQGLLNLLRIPVDVRNPEPALALAALVHKHDFEVTLNLTSVSCYSAGQFGAVARRVPDYVAAIYLADSRGALEVGHVQELVAAVRSGWQGAIGYHAHDNLGLAVETSRAALQAGCQWLDGSIAGIGIGGRNLRLEDALHLASAYRSDLDPDPQAFQIAEYDLGLSAPGEDGPLYRLAGQRNIRQEWVGPLVARLGRARAWDVIESLPHKAWFDEAELESFITMVDKEEQVH